MKRTLVLFLAGFLGVGSGFGAGEDMLGATLDGRKVVLHPDGTWEFRRKTAAGPTDALSLVDFEKADLPADIEAGQLAKRVKLTLYVRNAGTRPVKAWKAALAVKNVYDEVLATGTIVEDKAVLAPGDAQSVDLLFEDNRYVDDDPYDQLVVHDKAGLKAVLLDVKTVQ